MVYCIEQLFNLLFGLNVDVVYKYFRHHLLFNHTSAGCLIGSSNVNSVPLPNMLSAVILP